MRKSFLRTFAAALTAAAVLVLPVRFAAAQVETYPNRPVRFVVPLLPGGGNDFLARLFADRLQPALGQPVVVENKPGAGGNIGAEFVARQPADGYTLLMASTTQVVNLSFFAKLPYHPIRDFEPIALAATIPYVLAVNSNTAVHSMKDFIALARAKPGMITYATPGIGTPHHLAAELLKSMTGIDMVHVPYKGASGIVAALLAGDVTITIGAINSLLPHFRSGRLRPVAVAAGSPTPLLPGVPTIAEALPLPGYEIKNWYGVLAPAGTPRPIVDRLNAEINRILGDPQIISEKLAPNGFVSLATTPERFREVMKEDVVKYAKIAKDAKIQPQ